MSLLFCLFTHIITICSASARHWSRNVHSNTIRQCASSFNFLPQKPLHFLKKSDTSIGVKDMSDSFTLHPVRFS